MDLSNTTSDSTSAMTSDSTLDIITSNSPDDHLYPILGYFYYTYPSLSYFYKLSTDSTSHSYNHQLSRDFIKHCYTGAL